MRYLALVTGLVIATAGCDRGSAPAEAPPPPAAKADTPQQAHAKAMSRLANASAAAAANFEQSGQGIYLKELADRLRGFSNEGRSNPDSAAQKLAEASAADALAKYEAAKNAAIMADPEVIAAQAEVKAAFAALPHVPAPAPVDVAPTAATLPPVTPAVEPAPPQPAQEPVPSPSVTAAPAQPAPANAAEAYSAALSELAKARERAGARYDGTDAAKSAAAEVAKLESTLNQARKSEDSRQYLPASSAYNTARTAAASARLAAVSSDPDVVAAAAKAEELRPAAEQYSANVRAREQRAAEHRQRLSQPIGKLQVGAYGKLGPIKVLQVLGPKQMIATIGEETVWLEGFSTGDMVDDKSYIFEMPGRVVGTRRYETLLGVRTVFEIRPAI